MSWGLISFFFPPFREETKNATEFENVLEVNKMEGHSEEMRRESMAVVNTQVINL